ncbi:hypothetical protein PREVCOP_06626 [Segatella copri DSM 18205]|uniref:Uncharacterized protein n=1 Tax=Segatella copri DSM 18205 TaxID=537011 RepID=D1PHA7_9BACT|nr:hypothetical protein PREVCOP_06626 [Segatella copri DSM 18205]
MPSTNTVSSSFLTLLYIHVNLIFFIPNETLLIDIERHLLHFDCKGKEKIFLP